MTPSDNRIAIGLVSVMVAPIAGFLAMGVAWRAVVDSELRGGMDVGVVAVGAAVAALLVLAYAVWQSVAWRHAIPWIAAAFTATFAVALTAVWFVYSLSVAPLD